MYAVIKSGGKQHKVEEGEEILLEKLSNEDLDKAKNILKNEQEKKRKIFLKFVILKRSFFLNSKEILKLKKTGLPQQLDQNTMVILNLDI